MPSVSELLTKIRSATLKARYKRLKNNLGVHMFCADFARPDDESFQAINLMPLKLNVL